MSTFLKSLELASPLLLLTAVGYLLKKIKMLDEESSKKLSKLVLNLILPVSIFNYVYNSDFITAFNPKLIVFLLVFNVLIVVLMIFIAKLYTNDKKKLGALIQAGVRGNYSIFSLPLAISIYGESIAAPMTIAVAFLIPLYNVFAMALFEHYQDRRIKVATQIINVIKTPISIATVLGITLNLLHIELPYVILETLDYIGKSVTAISLINLGSSFNFKINTSMIKLLVIALFYKLVFTPLIAIPVASIMGFDSMSMIIILVIACAPIATSAFSTAVCYNTDIDLTSSCVVYSYLFCSITIPLFLSVVTLLELV